ncbi:MAG: hypothetical protein ACOCXQ_01010 [Patescibacteria group bacterium]
MKKHFSFLRQNFVFIGFFVGLLCHVYLGFGYVPVTWSYVLSVVALSGLILFAVSYPRVHAKSRQSTTNQDERKLPWLFPTLFVSIILLYLRDFIMGLYEWQYLTMSEQMSLVIGLIYACILSGAMIYAHFIVPNLPRSRSSKK